MEKPQSGCPKGAQLKSAGRNSLSRLGGGLDWPVCTRSTLDQHRYRLRCPTSAVFESTLLIRALMWLVKNGTPKSSWICMLQCTRVHR
jgi:hypothetical protein